MQNLIEADTAKIIPERGKKIALARLDIVRKRLEYHQDKNDKLKADYEFVQLHNVISKLLTRSPENLAGRQLSDF